MDEDEAKLVKMGMEVALRPVTEIASDLLGRAGGDWLHEKRIRNRKRLQDETAKILRDEGVSDPIEPSPSIAIPLLGAAQDESREELLALWAKLLAASMNPRKARNFRRAYIDLLSKLEPTDALVLKARSASLPSGVTPGKSLAASLNLPLSAVLVSFQTLIDLKLASNSNGEREFQIEHTSLTPLGIEMVKFLTDGDEF